MIEIGENLEAVIMNIIGCAAIVTVFYLSIRNDKK
ncbi:hypothetical protein [Riemerella phage vB_RanS_PT33]|nr:hypothetical protein Riean_1964 [Riemerella anatipestifer ATCC 11845 = DSM 15868]EFT36351.1 hypothetical protein RAYM_09180 [Riemerella anatipestifer RA-YM]UIS73915.1 hypothetical protein [Riemerella phage vB_RanS_PT03]UUJ74580.1 hypothetical protein [Riemerella phage vB_RanS_PT15]UVK80351.1 hypothetical protein [Riemerella phage vB_RanS_PT33]SNV79499.1 Uncharacterised protein [Riemerella anatipestifer]